MATPPLNRLSAVALTARRLLFHRALQTSSALFALVALATLFLPWHAVWTTGFGDDLACAFTPDCHPTPGPSPEERTQGPPDRIESGLEHHGAALAVMVGLILASELLSLLRARFRVGTVTSVLGLLAPVLLLGSALDFKHMFDVSRPLWGKHLHDPASVGLSLAALVDLVAQPILYIGARRAARRPAPLPGARLVPPA